MPNKNFRQLNPFEIKAEIINLISKLKDVNEAANYLDVIELLDAQPDKKTISKILFKEFYNLKTDDNTVLCFLLERYTDKEELSKKLWELLKNPVVSDNVKIAAVNFLRGLDSNWELDTGDELLNEEIIDADTKKLLNNALVNPEVQIDFLDFLNSLSTNDKITLISSLAEDYTADALANILIPVFLYDPESDSGITALKMLANSKSQLAYHALNNSLEFVSEKILPQVKKSISTLKIAGVREDNTEEFYKKILSESATYKFCITYPDGHGNQALIFTRKTNDNKIRFVAIVINDYHGVKDCFGFNEISIFECDKIIERFYKYEKEIYIAPEDLKSILEYAEKLSKQNHWLLPYEYICWKNLLSDIKSHNLIDTLTEKCKRKKLSGKDLDKIFQMDFMNKWFLDANYSDEFEELINTKTTDFEDLVISNVKKVFYPEEEKIWSKRLLMCAFLKLSENNKEDAELLYNLNFDDELKQELFKNILRKSIYEYYVSLKYNTELNNGKYALNELEDIISKIEDKWICTK